MTTHRLLNKLNNEIRIYIEYMYLSNATTNAVEYSKKKY